MTDPNDLNLPIVDRSVFSSAAMARKLGVWALEIIGEAIGTCLILTAFAFIQFRHQKPPLHNDFSLQMFFGISLFVLIEFAITGYVVTTFVLRFALRGSVRQLYPYACACLYLLHSTIFFVALGNPLLRVEDLEIQFAGAVLALACTWVGNRLVTYWDMGGDVSRANPSKRL